MAPCGCEKVLEQQRQEYRHLFFVALLVNVAFAGALTYHSLAVEEFVNIQLAKPFTPDKQFVAGLVAQNLSMDTVEYIEAKRKAMNLAAQNLVNRSREAP